MFWDTAYYIFVQPDGQALLAQQMMRMERIGKAIAEPAYDQRGAGTYYRLFPTLAAASAAYPQARIDWLEMPEKVQSCRA